MLIKPYEGGNVDDKASQAFSKPEPQTGLGIRD